MTEHACDMRSVTRQEILKLEFYKSQVKIIPIFFCYGEFLWYGRKSSNNKPLKKPSELIYLEDLN